MSHTEDESVFYYPKALHQPPPAIFKQGSKLAPFLNKPEGFRIPLIYFSWGILSGSRSLHHHPDNDEILLVLEGAATIRLYGPGKPEDPKKPRFEETYEVSAGDMILFPQGWVHSVEDHADDPADGREGAVKVLVIFNNQDFKSVEDGDCFELPNDRDRRFLGENAA